MEGKNTLFIIILVIVCALSISFVALSYKYAKDIELEYTEKEASIIKENMDLRDWVESEKEKLKEKIKEINAVKREKENLVFKLASAEEKNERLKELYSKQIKTLEGEKEIIQKEIRALKKMPLIEVIRKAKNAEEDENTKKVLERTLHNMELIKSGNVVDLKPIVVVEEEGPKAAVSSFTEKAKVSKIASSVQNVSGEILSVDRDNNLVVVSLGSKDGMREGGRLEIFNEEEKIASAEIINARYRISAAFIDDIRYKYTVRDIKNGNKVLIGK
jgi:hypothetical protein